MSVNNDKIRYAFRIVCPEYTVDVPSIGLYDGEIRFITGRTTTGLTFEDSTSAVGFQTGWLIDEPTNSLSTKIDISTGGNFNTINSCTVLLDNTNNFVGNMLSNNIYLVNREVHIYVVVDNVLYDRFGGVISEWKYNEKHFSFTCKDNNENNFKDLPVNESQQVIIGEDDYSPIKFLDSKVDFFNSYFAYEYKQIDDPITNKKLTELTLITPRTVDDLPTINQDDLAGKYIKWRIIGEPINQKPDVSDSSFVKIVSNSETIFLDESIYWNLNIKSGEEVKPQIYGVKLILESPMEDILQSDVLNSGENIWRNSQINYQLGLVYNGELGGVGAQNKRIYTTFNRESSLKTVFDIFTVESTFVICEGELNDYTVNSDGTVAVYAYANDKYIKVNIKGKVEYDAVNNRTILIVNAPKGSEIITYTAIYADQANSFTREFSPYTQVNEETNDEVIASYIPEQYIEVKTVMNDPVFNSEISPQSDYPAVISNLDGFNEETGKYDFPIAHQFHIKMNEDFNWDDYDNIYLSTVLHVDSDIDNQFDTTNDSFFMFNVYETIPNASRFLTKSDPEGSLYNGPVYNDGSKQMLYSYYTGTEDTDVVYAATNTCVIPVVSNGSVSDLLKKSLVENEVFFSPIFDTNNMTGGIETQKAEQIFPNYYKTNEEGQYTELEVVYKEDFLLSTNPIKNNEFDILFEPDEFLRKKYWRNENPLAPIKRYKLLFRVRTIYLTGEKKVNINDLFVKTTGVNLSDTEKIPVTNVYDTYKYLLETANDFNSIDYGNVVNKRNIWNSNRTLKQKTSSKNLIKNLAEQSFVGVFTTRFGNIALDAFYGSRNERDETTRNKWIHDNKIIKDKSIKSVVPVNQAKIYNNIELSYDFNYATTQFNNTYYITNVKESTFPETGDYSKYASLDMERTTAQFMWTMAREVYLRYNIENSAPDNLSKCYWYSKPESVGLTESSIHYYLQNLIEWAGQQKQTIKYQLPINSDTITIDLLDRVEFSDVLITGGQYVDAWVTSVGVNKNVIDIEIIVAPEELLTTQKYQIIDEAPDSTEQIDEDSVTGEQINEDFTLF